MRPHEMDRAMGMVADALALAPPEALPPTLVAKCCACGGVGPSVGGIMLTVWVGGRGHVRRLYCATRAPAETVQGLDFPAQWVYDFDGCQERQREGAGR